MKKVREDIKGSGCIYQQTFIVCIPQSLFAPYARFGAWIIDD